MKGMSKDPGRARTMVEYYEILGYDCATGGLASPEAWRQHVARRRNLYETHLHLPLGLLRGRRVLEFGPASGDNALVLAAAGARLVLVEPSNASFPALRERFQRAGWADRIEDCVQADLADFAPAGESFDLVVAEGFLGSLEGREAILRRMGGWVAPGGFLVFSFNDTYGSFLELLRKALFWRGCELASVDPLSPDGLALAQRLYGSAFARLSTARPIKAWWVDALVIPFLSVEHTWTYDALLDLLEPEGFDLLGCSPNWMTSDLFDWYKNLRTDPERGQAARRDYARALPFLLGGRGCAPADGVPPETVRTAVREAVRVASRHARRDGAPFADLGWPPALAEYLAQEPGGFPRELAREIPAVLRAAQSGPLEALASALAGAAALARHWGATYHYACFRRSLDLGAGPFPLRAQGDPSEACDEGAPLSFA